MLVFSVLESCAFIWIAGYVKVNVLTGVSWDQVILFYFNAF